MKKILAVDDSASVRHVVSFTLKSAGYNIDVAEDGMDALQKMKETDYGLLITDINMPNLDGIGLVREIRAMKQYKFIPIIVVTTETQVERKDEGKKAGVTGWIVKPFKPEQLLGVVKKVYN